MSDDKFWEAVGLDKSVAGTPLHEWLGCEPAQVVEFLVDDDEDNDE